MTRYWRAPDWYPTGTELTFDPPPVGSLIAIEHRVVEVWAHHPRDDGSMTLGIRRLHGAKIPGENDRAEQGLSFKGRPMWRVYKSRRIPLCSDCGEPWPCQDEMGDRQAVIDMRFMADQIEKAGDGQCYSCGEHITRRQAATTAPEDNVEIPGFPPPQFHLRQSCRDGLDRYEALRRKTLKGDWTPLVADPESLPGFTPSKEES